MVVCIAQVGDASQVIDSNEESCFGFVSSHEVESKIKTFEFGCSAAYSNVCNAPILLIVGIQIETKIWSSTDEKSFRFVEEVQWDVECYESVERVLRIIFDLGSFSLDNYLRLEAEVLIGRKISDEPCLECGEYFVEIGDGRLV